MNPDIFYLEKKALMPLLGKRGNTGKLYGGN